MSTANVVRGIALSLIAACSAVNEHGGKGATDGTAIAETIEVADLLRPPGIAVGREIPPGDRDSQLEDLVACLQDATGGAANIVVQEPDRLVVTASPEVMHQVHAILLDIRRGTAQTR
jgi:hypothetical protein